MYKFEIIANTPRELEEKLFEFAENLMNDGQDIPSSPVIPLAPMQQSPQTFPQVSQVPIAPEVQQRIEQTVVQKQVEKIAAPTIYGQIELDSRGLPWDGRIHSSTRAKVKDGSWRNRKGVEDSLVAQVEAQLKGSAPHVVASVQQTIVPPPPAPTVAVTMPTFEDRNKATPFENTVPLAAVPAQPASVYENIQVPQGVRPTHNLISFKNNFMVLMAQLINEGKISQEYINQLKTYFNVKEIWNILGNEAQCIELYNSFGELGFITKVD